MNFLNKIILSIITFSAVSMSVFAYDIDTTVDDEIRKKYNPSKIEDDLLPPLPKSLQKSKNKPIVVSNPTLKELTPQNNVGKKVVSTRPTKYITVREGSIFGVRLTQQISGSSPVGSQIYFKTISKMHGLPEGTKFRATIADAHPPQFTANGGLIVIKIDTIWVNNSMQDISAYVTEANHKKVYFNNIKGKRKYWKSMFNSTKGGRKFYSTMWKTTKDLSKESPTLLLAPIPFITGVAVLGANTFMAPVFAVFSRGENIVFPEGTYFEIKVIQDANIRL